MKLIAICLNVLMLVTALYFFADYGIPSSDEDMYLMLIMFIVPISSLVALLLSDDRSWLGLYFKRKALEEKKRIDELNN